MSKKFNPWIYDIDKNGKISKAEALKAISDYFAGKITKGQILEVLLLYFGLPFDPWIYDVNKSCYIEVAELLQAVNDYFAALITIEQYQEVRALWENYTKNPACPEEDELLKELKSGEVGANWWSYSLAERWEIAHYVAEYCAKLPIGTYSAKGARECAGAPFYQKVRNKCHNHLCIRYSLIGDCSTCRAADPGVGWGNNCFENYWQDKDGNWHCYYNPDCFKLPMHWCSLTSWWFLPEHAVYLTHAICALPVGTNLYDFNSWLFFQYTDAEIKPGVKPKVTANTMKVGDLVTVNPIIFFNGYMDIKTAPGDPLAGWKITEAGAIPYYGPWEK